MFTPLATVMVAVACRVVSPAASAVMMAVPALTPLTRPLAETVATEGALVRQSTPVGAPRSPEMMAASCVAPPVDTVTDEGDTEMLLMLGTTVTVALARRVVSATEIAVTRVVPKPVATTSPVALTVAMAGFSVRQVTAVLTPGSACTVAANWRA